MIVPRAYLFAFILAVSPALSASQKTSQPQRAQEEAAALWSSGNREESIARLTKALADDPEDIALREQLARQQLVVHRYAAALETTQAAGQALQHITAEALFYLDRFEEALPLLDSSDPTQALARVTAFEVLGYSDEATAALDEMVDLAGVDLLGMSLARGRLHAAAGRHEDAAFAYQSVLDKQPNDPGALFGLGQAWVRTGRREQGLELLKRHRELVPLLDQLDFALRALDMAPTHAPHHALVGDAQRAMGQLKIARESYQAAMDMATPEQLPMIALRLARMLEEDQNRWEQALATLQQASQHLGQDSPDVRLQVRAGDILVRANLPARAVEHYRQALKQRPEDAAIQQRLEAALSMAASPAKEQSP
ncbi:MAG: tetratricopeptide repeat protein [Planctomycetota bacterium]|jgi:tetratricopeptide (TPR) repeat protein|nr:tetratricopeptide repeat protein [Planctomycetota bacterium]